MVDNDANLGALAEAAFGAGRDASDLVYLKVSSGIGAGLILNGRLYRGSAGLAGELGHVLVDPDGHRLPLRQPRLPGDRRRHQRARGLPARHPRRRLHDRRDARGRPRRRRRCRAARSGAGRALGKVAATLLNVLNPEMLVVGGHLAAAGDLLLDGMRESVARAALPETSRGAAARRGRARRARPRARRARAGGLRGRPGAARPASRLAGLTAATNESNVAVPIVSRVAFRGHGADFTPRRSGAGRRGSGRGRGRVARGSRAPCGARALDGVRRGQRPAGRRARRRARRAGAPARARAGRPPAGADRAAPQGGRGRRDRLRQAPPADGDLRSLATSCWPSATARWTPICPRARRSRSRRRMFEDALEEAERPRRRAGRRRHGPAGPGAPSVGRARQLDDPAGLGRDPRRGRRLRGARPRASRSRTTPTSARSASGCGAPAAAPTTWPT